MFNTKDIDQNKYNILIGCVIVFLLIIFFSGLYYFYQLSYEAQVDSFLEHQRFYVSIIKEDLTNRLETIINKPYKNNIKNSEKINNLDFKLHSLPEIKYLAYFTQTGEIKLKSNRFSKQQVEGINTWLEELSKRYWEQIEGDYYIGPLKMDKDEQLMPVFYPVGQQGEKKAIVLVSDLSELANKYVAPIQLKENGFGYLIDGQGRVVYDHATEIIAENVFDLHQNYDQLLSADKQMINKKQGTASYEFLVRNLDKKERKYVSWDTIKLGANKLIVAIATPESDIMGGIELLRNEFILLSIILIITLFLTGILFFKLKNKALINNAKNLEEKYNKQTQNLRMLSEMVEQSENSIIQTNTKGQIEYVNQATEELFGWSADELQGTVPKFLNFAASTQEGICQILTQGKVYQDELLNQRKDGSSVWCQIKIVPLTDEQGKVYAYMGIQQDITSQKEREQKLKEAKSEAEVANQAKSEFLANMSHEIRTPLNAVIGFSELLANMVVDGQQQVYLDSIKTAGKNLLTLINDILDLSKIEAGELVIECNYFNLDRLLLDMEQMFSQKVSEQGLDFMLDIEDELPLIKLDETRLRQILLNLIGNAVKFTEEGYIKVIVGISCLGEDDLDLYLKVVDTGIGITKDKQEEIFASFQQQDSSINKEYEGTGLGLAITKRLTEMMNGKISLTSQAGQGSEFKLEFNNIHYKELEEKKSEGNNKLKFKSAKVLVVDDVLSNRRLMAEILEEAGLESVSAQNGEQALSLATKQEFDLILLDLKLPGLDGYQVLNKLKRSNLNDTTPVIGVTASATKDELTKVKQADFAAFLAKPIDRNNFLEQLTNYLSYSREGNTDYKLEEISFELKEDDLEEVISILEEEFISQYEELKQIFIINEVEDFAIELLDLANKYQIDFLAEYAKNLRDYANNFELFKAKKSFSEFSELVEKLVSEKGRDNNEQESN